MKKHHFKICLKIAQKSIKKHPRGKSYKHFTFIIQNDRLIDYGMNRTGDAPKNMGYKDHQLIHSEYDAFQKAKGLLNLDTSFEAINIRLSSTGELRNSSPCKNCSTFMKRYGCSAIYYTTENNFEKYVEIT